LFARRTMRAARRSARARRRAIARDRNQRHPVIR
jgi:hypothetical protein